MSKTSTDLSRLGIIAVIFNPVRYRTRYDQYYKFRDHMRQSGVHLYTVECIFDATTRFCLPAQHFEITEKGNPYHFQFVAPSVIWMKENLINLAVQRLPSYIDRIAWIDADVQFERLDWPYLTMMALEKYPILQMFKIGYFLGPNGKNEILRRDHSFGYSIRRGKSIYPQNPHWYAHPGYAWAMHRDLFNDIGGLADFCIVGSGDLHFAYALLGRIEESFPRNLHKDYRIHAKIWGDTVAQLAGKGTFVSYVPVNLYHSWHGSRENRSYIQRWSILSNYQFSPRKDLSRNKYSGVIYLKKNDRFGLSSSSDRIDGLHRQIVKYFLSRDEDSRRILIPKLPLRPKHRRRRKRSYPPHIPHLFFAPPILPIHHHHPTQLLDY